MAWVTQMRHDITSSLQEHDDAVNILKKQDSFRKTTECIKFQAEIETENVTCAREPRVREIRVRPARGERWREWSSCEPLRRRRAD